MFLFLYDSYCSFVNNFIFFLIKLIIFVVCSLKDSQNSFMLSLPLYKSCLFPLFFDLADTKKPDVICLLTFVVDEFSGLFLHLSIFSVKH